MLLLILKDDPRQRQSRENYFAFGAFAQNLMLLYTKRVLVLVEVATIYL